MRTIERDIMLFLLAVSAGSADGWSYIGLGHAFVANMTGNTVLLGIAVFEKNGDLAHPAISLASYAVGVAIASLLTRNTPPGVKWAKSISWTLLFESLLLVGAATGWIVLHRYSSSPSAGSPQVDLLLSCVALAVGLQSGAMLQLKVPGIVTTYITGTWTQMISGLQHFVATPSPRDRREEVQFEGRLWMQFGILATYFASAVCTGYLLRYWSPGVGMFAALPVLLVSLYGVFRLRMAGQDRS